MHQEWTEQEFQRVEESLLGVAEVFAKTLTKTTMQVYLRIMQKYKAEVAVMALQKSISVCKFFPKPAEIIEIVEGNMNDKASLAWMVLMQALESEGGYRSVTFEDPRINSAILFFGGWERVAEWKVEEMPYRRQDFIKFYTCCSWPKPGYKHVGIFEREQMASGYSWMVKPPIHISITGERTIYLPEQKMRLSIEAPNNNEEEEGISDDEMARLVEATKRLFSGNKEKDAE
jgi:hypothetical protein